MGGLPVEVCRSGVFSSGEPADRPAGAQQHQLDSDRDAATLRREGSGGGGVGWGVEGQASCTRLGREQKRRGDRLRLSAGRGCARLSAGEPAHVLPADVRVGLPQGGAGVGPVWVGEGRLCNELRGVAPKRARVSPACTLRRGRCRVGRCRVGRARLYYQVAGGGAVAQVPPTWVKPYTPATRMGRG